MALYAPLVLLLVSLLGEAPVGDEYLCLLAKSGQIYGRETDVHVVQGV